MSIQKYLQERILNEGVEYFGVDPEDLGDEEDVSYEDLEAVEELAKKNDINILRDKSINTIAKDRDKVIGGLWTSWDDNKFSFDVVVDITYGGQQIGTKLVDMAIDQFKYENDAYDEPIMKIDVISHIMKKILEKKGFEIESERPGRWVMVRQ